MNYLVLSIVNINSHPCLIFSTFYIIGIMIKNQWMLDEPEPWKIWELGEGNFFSEEVPTVFVIR